MSLEGDQSLFLNLGEGEMPDVVRGETAPVALAVEFVTWPAPELRDTLQISDTTVTPPHATPPMGEVMQAF